MRQIMVEAEAVVREMPPPAEVANADGSAAARPEARKAG
jgi:hypothetical protein